MGRRNPPLFYKTKKMAIRFSNGFGIGASNNGGGGGGGPVVNCSPSSTLGGNLYYSSGTTLTWTDDTSGYTQYTGGYTNPDDGYANQAITLPLNFFMNCTGSTKLYLSTNGFVRLVARFDAACHWPVSSQRRPHRQLPPRQPPRSQFRRLPLLPLSCLRRRSSSRTTSPQRSPTFGRRLSASSNTSAEHSIRPNRSTAKAE